MGSRRVLALVGVIAGLVLIAYAVFGGRSDEELIRDQLHRLARVVSFEQPGNVVARGLTLRGAFGELFVENPRGEIPELGSPRNSRASLVELGLQSSSFARSLSLSFADVRVEVDPKRSGAEVAARVDVQAVTREGQGRSEERLVRFSFAKTQDGWQIARFRVLSPDEEDSVDE
jgi:hypothetical protein